MPFPHLALPEGIKKSFVFEVLNSRGLEQVGQADENLQKHATAKLPPPAKRFSCLGNLILVDGALIDATLSMVWANYCDGAKKAKVHLGFVSAGGFPKNWF